MRHSFAASIGMAEAFLVYSTTGILNILVVMLSGLVTRFIPCAVMGYYLMVTTRVSEFMAAMERMHVTREDRYSHVRHVPVFPDGRGGIPQH